MGERFTFSQLGTSASLTLHRGSWDPVHWHSSLIFFVGFFFFLWGCVFVFLLFQYGLVSNGQCVLKFRLPYKVLVILSLHLLNRFYLFSAKGHLQFRISSLACRPNIKCHIKKIMITDFERGKNCWHWNRKKIIRIIRNFLHDLEHFCTFLFPFIKEQI